MIVKDIIKAFEIEVNADENLILKPTTSNSLYCINLTINKFVKLRFNKDVVHRTSFEENEKRRNDLRKLITDSDNILATTVKDFKGFVNVANESTNTYSGTDGIVKFNTNKNHFCLVVTVSSQQGTNTTYYTKWPNSSDYLSHNNIYCDISTNDKIKYYYSDTLHLVVKGAYHSVYPLDFLYVLNEDVVIKGTEDGAEEYATSVFECTRDSYKQRMTNSLTDFHYNYGKARPIRVCTNYGCELYTDGKYTVEEYKIGYIRRPKEITFQSSNDANSEYLDFDESTLYEIIKMAAQMYLENITNERYKTISQEVLTQE